eukprot:Polyplicarium_translucidae@DN3093_c0_g1_i5.p1
MMTRTDTNEPIHHTLTPSTSCTALADQDRPVEWSTVQREDPFDVPRLGVTPASGILLKRGSSWPHVWRLRRVALRGGMLTCTPLRPEEGGSHWWCWLCNAEALASQTWWAVRSMFSQQPGDHEGLMLKGVYSFTRDTHVATIDGPVEGHDNCVGIFEAPPADRGTDESKSGTQSLRPEELPTCQRVWIISCINRSVQNEWIVAIREALRLQLLVESSQLIDTEDYRRALRIAQASLSAATRHNAVLRTQLCGAESGSDARIVDFFVDGIRQKEDLAEL